MGLYIPGMELPEKGKYRTIIIYDDGTVCAHYEDRQLGKAVPVPAHGRLIDADALNYTMIYREHWLRGIGYEALAVWAEDIKNAPTIIPTEEGNNG